MTDAIGYLFAQRRPSFLFGNSPGHDGRHCTPCLTKLTAPIKSEQFAHQPRGQARLPDLELDQLELPFLLGWLSRLEVQSKGTVSQVRKAGLPPQLRDEQQGSDLLGFDVFRQPDSDA